MAEFRTSSGLVSCDVFMRTANGLVQMDPQFRTGSGLVDCGSATGSGGSGGALSASVDNPSVYGSVSRAQPTRVYTNTATALASGGTGPYAYAWGAQSGWQVENPTAPSSRFSATVGPGGTQNATFTCTVTDAKGATATVQVQAEVDNYYSGGGGRADIQ